MRSIVCCLLLAGSAVACTQAPAQDNLAGFQLASHCMACHGPAGKSPGSIPALYGKSSDFIQEQLRAFRDGTVESTVMGRLARGYTDEEIVRIADYISALSDSE